MSQNRVVIARIEQKIRERLPDSPETRKKLLRIGMILKQESVTAYKRSGLKVQTGTLINSLQAIYDIDGDRATVRFGPFGVRYAAIHEFGGIIQARTQRYLHYKIGGEWKQSRRVRIPARPYLRPTLTRSRRRILKVLEGE